MSQSTPDAATRQFLYLARHGRTALNAEGRLRGLADPPLDDIGLAEAARLGEALAREATRPGREPTALVLSSPPPAGGEHRGSDRVSNRHPYRSEITVPPTSWSDLSPTATTWTITSYDNVVP